MTTISAVLSPTSSSTGRAPAASVSCRPWDTRVASWLGERQAGPAVLCRHAVSRAGDRCSRRPCGWKGPLGQTCLSVPGPLHTQQLLPAALPAAVRGMPSTRAKGWSPWMVRPRGPETVRETSQALKCRLSRGANHWLLCRPPARWGAARAAPWRDLSLRGGSGGRKRLQTLWHSQGYPRSKVSERVGERRGPVPAPAPTQAGPGGPSPRTKMWGSEDIGNSPREIPALPAPGVCWSRGASCSLRL